MAVKWNKIYRGGVHRTTPETREVNAPTTGTFLPGTAVTITATAGDMTVQKGITGERDFWYLIGEQLHGSVDDNQVGSGSSMRLYTPRSADLMAGRLVAGVAIADDVPLTINADGRFALAVADGPIHAYIDDPANAFPGTTPTTSTLDQLVPIKIR